ncbi:DNA-binding response OmpR family regulator [Acetoanaerobium pronyense]|uniref:Stage 0 sporulation protein A homolog n=1 Tax=Acetoanaerobium pronyense TaxID=1482736 RepID=A0ABS4KHB8_9FIRM|nr:response regulator transcription factor [Acetoanaerobium pronyense]MBP2027179.1 DNA-binding response OmpR family regulator [Acetoanaerobium pronyense]
MRVLIIEDEVHLAEALSQILKKQNYTSDMIFDGEMGLDHALTGIYDVILLDIMIPKLDGISVLKKLRKENITTPVIMLTAKGDIKDRITGLDSGADDYLPKPFSTEELMARIRAVSRRKGEIPKDNLIRFEDLSLDPSTLKLASNSNEIKLTLKESELMELLILRHKLISSKELIIEKLWGFDSDVEHNHVEVYISFLRKKLLFLKSNVSIETIRGAGYILEVKR